MESALQEINAVGGVNGSFICAMNGKIIAQAMPQTFDTARLNAIAKLAGQTVTALELSRQHVNDIDLVFEKERLILKNLNGGVLIIFCARTINLPLLNMTANNAVESLSAKLKDTAPEPSAAISTNQPPIATTNATMQPHTPAAADTSPLYRDLEQEYLKWMLERKLAPGETSPLYRDLEQESQRLISAARSAQLSLCVMDPIALWARSSVTRARVAQPQKRYMDFLARSDQASLVIRVFERLGYQPNQRFNAFYGARFLNFNEPTRITSINIFLDAYDQYHRVDLTNILAQNETLMTETGLTLIRLQNVEITDSILNELIALFLEHELGAGMEKGKIDATQITRLCSEDWGWYRTVTMNLDRLRAFVEKELSPSEEALVVNRIQRLRQGIDAAPKSLRWQTRARIGISVRWYETPQIGGAGGARPDMAMG